MTTTVDDLLADLLGDEEDADVTTPAMPGPVGVPDNPPCQPASTRQTAPGRTVEVEPAESALDVVPGQADSSEAVSLFPSGQPRPAIGHSSQIPAVDAPPTISVPSPSSSHEVVGSTPADPAASITSSIPSLQAQSLPFTPDTCSPGQLGPPQTPLSTTLDAHQAVSHSSGVVLHHTAPDTTDVMPSPSEQDDDLDLLSLDGLADVLGGAELDSALPPPRVQPAAAVQASTLDAAQQPLADQSSQHRQARPALVSPLNHTSTASAESGHKAVHGANGTTHEPAPTAAPAVPALQLPGTTVSSLESLELAEQAERSLLTSGPGSGGAASLTPPGELLEDLLSGARQDWPAQGRPDAAGAMIGGSVALKLEEVQTVVPDLKAVLGKTRLHYHYQPGTHQPKVVAIQGPVLAIGMSSGVTVILQLPSIKAASAAAATGAGGPMGPDPTAQQMLHSSSARHSTAAQPGQAGGQGNAPGAKEHAHPLLFVGEARGDAEAVTALGFSRVESSAEALWLVVGHASGTVVVWDLQRRPARQAVLIRGQHGLPVTHASFLPGRATSMIITVDRRGRLMSHLLATNLLLMRTSAASKPLLDGSLGIISSVSHLQPYSAALLPASSPAGTTTTATTTSQAIIGDGVTALCTLTGCHIVRFRPTGELILLMVVPRPQQVPSNVLPIAAWLRHTQHTFTPNTLTGTLVRRSAPGSAGGAGGVDSGSQTEAERLQVPCATLAVSWGHLVLFCDIPLLGDHRHLDESSGGADANHLPSPASGASSQSPAASGGQLGMSLFRSMTAAAAAGASQLMAGSTLDALTPQLVKQLSQAFPIQVLRKWDTCALDPDADRSDHDAGPGTSTSQLQVLGLHWYDGDALGVVVAQGLQMRLAVLGPDLEIREQVDCFDTLPPSTTLTVPPGGCCCPEALSGQGSRVLMLGSSGTLYCSRLMGWQERLRTLQDVGKLPLALWYGLQFYHMHLAKKTAAAACGQPPKPHDVTTMQQLAQWLLNLLAIHSQDRLQAAIAQAEQTGGWVQPAVQLEVSRLAQLCICCCLFLGMQQPLFQQLFTVFQQAQSALASNRSLLLADEEELAGLVKLHPLGQFLEALEPHILADRLPFLAPEVVHALVEHFAGAGAADGSTQPERVERCVLHLEVFTLDLDQVLRLCSSHGLYSALIYVHNRINEYRQPVIDMLAHLAGLQPNPNPSPPGQSSSVGVRRSPAASISPQRLVHKLLVYLRCVFRGQAFPPGSGSLEAQEELSGGGMQPGEDLRAQLLGLLLFTDTQDLARLWQVHVSKVQQVVTDPYPALQLLLRADAAATVSVLGDAVCGWDAVETELRAAAGKQTEELDSVLVATQVLVNALLLLDSLLQSPGSTAHTAILDFVTSLVTARRVTVQPAVVLQLLQHVLQPPPSSTVLQLPAAVSGDHDSGLGSARLSASGVDPSLLGQLAELQAAVQPGSASERLAVSIIDVAGVNSVHASKQAPDRLGHQESKAAIEVLLAHGLHLGAAKVAHARGEVGRALAQHLALAHPAAPFLYIHSCLKSGQSWVRQALLDGLLAVSSQLTTRSPTATAAALLVLDAKQQNNLLSHFQDAPELRFKLLRALLGLSGKLHLEAQQQGVTEDDGESESSAHSASLQALLTPGVSGDDEASLEGEEAGVDTSLLISLLLPYGAPTIPRNQDLRYDPAACDDYVALACQYCPPAVLPFLLTHVSYDVHKCLAAVRAAGVREAHVYLLERLGQLGEAFRLHLARIKESSADLAHVDWSSIPVPVHVAWLLSLSPRLKTVLPQIFGPAVYTEAVQQYAAAPSTSRAPSILPPLSATPPRLTTYSQAAGPRGRQRKDSAVVSVGLLPSLPDELRVFWSALTAGTSFCQRCSRAEKSLQRPDGAGPQPRGAAGRNTHPSDSGARAAAGPDSAGEAGSTRTISVLSSSSQPAAAYWLQLLEVCIHELRKHSTDPVKAAAIATARGSRGVLNAAVEEVVSRAAEHVQMFDLVSHITLQHGQAAVGEFRNLLAGLLSACSYEQAIMEAALRLLARDAMSQVKQRCQQHSGSLTGAQLAQTSGSGADGSGRPGSSSSSQPPAGHHTCTDSGQDKEGVFSLLTDRVHDDLLTSHVAARGARSRRQAPPAGLVFVLEGGAGEASSALDGLAAAGLDPRAAAWKATATRGTGGSGAGDFHALTKHRRQAVHAFLSVDALHSMGLHSHGTAGERRWHQATSGGGHLSRGQQQGQVGDGRDSFDVDNLLQWATQASAGPAAQA